MLLKTLSLRNLTVLKSNRYISGGMAPFDVHSCKLLIVGGGSGGCSVAAKFANGVKDGEIIIVEPSDVHYYQPMFTLIGGGIKALKDASKPMSDVLPKKAKWFKHSVTEFKPQDNYVKISNGDKIEYDFMLVAIGLQLNYDKIPGLVDALGIPDGDVCSNYSPNYVQRTYQALQNFESGNVVFTYPNTPVKCPGAPQKICYIAEHYLRNVGKRIYANIVYNTSLPVIFGVKKYADALWKVVEKRNITVNLRTNLIEVKPLERLAVFQNLDKPENITTMPYSFLHVTPPMSTPDVLRNCKDLVTETGFMDVHKDTLRHNKYPNVFSIGDCSSTPNSKTAASVAAQSHVVYKNMKSVMDGRKPTVVYDGYASCPLVTGYGSCILAEFDYDLNPLETFPMSQDKEMWMMYSLKKDFMPPLYWHLMLNGHWNGPEPMRKVMHFKFT